MNSSNPSLALQAHLATMPSSTSALTSTTLISPRLGLENMDGQPILSSHSKSHARPWLGFIPTSELTKDNLPPFYVRLQDDQVGHLAQWVSATRSSITIRKLGQFWPWDFDSTGKILLRRESWGAEYGGEGFKGLDGGKKVPTFTDLGLPLTYTSSHKIMAGELAALKAGATLKRKADEEAGRNACVPVKKPRIGNMGAELKKMKESGEKARLKDKAVAEKEKEKERYYAGAKPEIRDAVQIVDTLMRKATETEKQNATLEAMLLKNEARYGKDTDEMFDEWLAYIEVKRVEVDRIHEDHAVEVKERDAKIGVLETETKGFRARLDKAKKRVEVRDERLAQVKSRWVHEQGLVEKKLREMEEMTVDLDELSELNYETDESDDEEADFEAEPEKAEGQTKEQQMPEHKEVKEAKEAKEPEAKGPTNRELAKSLAREIVKSVSATDLINLAEDEDESSEDEGPISSQRKLRSKLARTL